MTAPRITVLLAVHNGEPYVRECVESVCAQTFSDLELLVVDDASTDSTVETIRKLDDPRIRLLKNERNIGQVPSLNKGLGEAYGVYVARIDADDAMLPTRLERQVEVLDADPLVALVGTWMEVVDDRGKGWGTSRGWINDYADFVSAILTDRIPFGHPSIMFRRDPVRVLGGYDASLAPSEDKDLYRRLAVERHEARVVPAALTRYRRHETQLSQLQMQRQLDNDHAGQERFLGALAPNQPARTLRLLLAGDTAFWNEPPLEELESFLDGATNRLRLSAAERAVVAGTVAACCARALLAAWSSPIAADAAHAAAPAAFAAAYGTRAARTALMTQPLLRASRPFGLALHSARVRTRTTLRRSERLAPIRRVARGSRTLRRLYTALLGFRLLDDHVDGR